MLLAHKGRRVRQGLPEPRARKGLSVIPEQQAQSAHKDLWDLLVLPGPRARKDPLVLQAQRGALVQPEQQAPRVRQALLEPRGPQARPVSSISVVPRISW